MPTYSESQLNSWLEMLRSPDLNDRLVAAKTLQHLGDEEAIEGLTIALKDESFAVQKIALSALREMATPAIIPAFIESLASPDLEIRQEASSALGELISSEHLSLLLDALNSPNSDVQLAILTLLRKIHDARSLPHILPFLESNLPELRAAAVTTVSYLNQVDRCPQALALLSDPEATVRQAATLTLGHLSDAGVVSLLSQSLIGDTDWKVRRNAAKSLGIHANSEAIPALVTALKDPHWQVRKCVAQALQTIRFEEESSSQNNILAVLVTALADEYSDVRKEAAIAIENLGNIGGINALQQALDDPDKEVSIYAQRALKKIQELVSRTPNARS